MTGERRASFDALYFQIGFKRCGTSAIAAFFNRSGIPCVHFDRGRLAQRMRDNLASGLAPLEGYGAYRAFTNMDYIAPFDYFDGFKQYSALLSHYGGRARFILNTRPREHWIRSVMAHNDRRLGRLAAQKHYKWRYGAERPDQVKDCLRAEWEDHHARVQQEIPAGQLLVFDVERDSPGKLCAFAGLPPSYSRFYTLENPSLNRFGLLIARCLPLAVKRALPNEVRLALKKRFKVH